MHHIHVQSRMCSSNGFSTPRYCVNHCIILTLTWLFEGLIWDTDLTYSLLKQQRTPGSDSTKPTLPLPNPAQGQPRGRRASFDLAAVRTQRSDSSYDKRHYPYSTLPKGSLGLREYETWTPTTQGQSVQGQTRVRPRDV